MKDVNILKNYGVDVSKALELLGDMRMYNEVMSDFLSMIGDKINLLNQYKSVNDMTNYAIEVHSLKSDVRYLGFMGVGELAYELELKSKENDIAAVSAKHDNLINEVNKMVNVCKQYLEITTPSAPETPVQTPAPVTNTAGMDPMSQALVFQENMTVEDTSSNTPKDGVILIVDDSEMIGNFVKKVFNSKYEIVICKDGGEAIEYCKNDENRAKIKSCLLDLNMPNVDGFHVLEFFKENNYFVKLPVVVISGIEDRALLQKANSYPIVGILAKPFNERDVTMSVNQCLATYF